MLNVMCDIDLVDEAGNLVTIENNIGILLSFRSGALKVDSPHRLIRGHRSIKEEDVLAALDYQASAGPHAKLDLTFEGMKSAWEPIHRRGGSRKLYRLG